MLRAVPHLPATRAIARSAEELAPRSQIIEALVGGASVFDVELARRTSSTRWVTTSATSHSSQSRRAGVIRDAMTDLTGYDFGMRTSTRGSSRVAEPREVSATVGHRTHAIRSDDATVFPGVLDFDGYSPRLRAAAEEWARDNVRAVALLEGSDGMVATTLRVGPLPARLTRKGLQAHMLPTRPQAQAMHRIDLRLDRNDPRVAELLDQTSNQRALLRDLDNGVLPVGKVHESSDGVPRLSDLGHEQYGYPELRYAYRDPMRGVRALIGTDATIEVPRRLV